MATRSSGTLKLQPHVPFPACSWGPGKVAVREQSGDSAGQHSGQSTLVMGDSSAWAWWGGCWRRQQGQRAPLAVPLLLAGPWSGVEAGGPRAGVWDSGDGRASDGCLRSCAGPHLKEEAGPLARSSCVALPITPRQHSSLPKSQVTPAFSTSPTLPGLVGTVAACQEETSGASRALPSTPSSATLETPLPALGRCFPSSTERLLQGQPHHPVGRQ